MVLISPNSILSMIVHIYQLCIFVFRQISYLQARSTRGPDMAWHGRWFALRYLRQRGAGPRRGDGHAGLSARLGYSRERALQILFPLSCTLQLHYLDSLQRRVASTSKFSSGNAEGLATFVTKFEGMLRIFLKVGVC